MINAEVQAQKSMSQVILISWLILVKTQFSVFKTIVSPNKRKVKPSLDLPIHFKNLCQIDAQVMLKYW